jgi:membrane carboxypeptidase/penicillin-binding protein
VALRKLKLPRFTWRRLALVVLVVLLLGALLWQRCGWRGCPNIDQLSAYQPGGQSILYDANGKRFEELAPIQHEVVKLSSLPDYVTAAFFAFVV